MNLGSMTAILTHEVTSSLPLISIFLMEGRLSNPWKAITVLLMMRLGSMFVANYMKKNKALLRSISPHEISLRPMIIV